jgi:hypothetical protein
MHARVGTGVRLKRLLPVSLSTTADVGLCFLHSHLSL